jgi:putative DNA primase/helicase
MGTTADEEGFTGRAALAAGGHVPTSAETLTNRVVTTYLTSISDDPDVDLEEIRDALLQRINAELSMESKLRKDSLSSSPPLTKLQALDEMTIVRVLLARHRIVAINLAGSRSSEDAVLAMYADLGPDEGLYVIGDAPIAQLASEIRPSFTANAIESLMKRMKTHAPVVAKTTDAHLIPVANGIFDHDAQELLPFSSEHVFLTKSPISYDLLALNPVIDTPDGDQWDVETWIQDLSDDEGVPELLWEILSAVVRPGVRWNKAAFLHSTRGNNGKGTFCHLARNLVGSGGHASIPIADFGKDFALTELIHARAIIVDENDVGAFASSLSDLKSVITGDALSLSRKYKDPVTLRFSGMVVQCVNDFPKSRDKSASYTRRQLFVPFKKWFGGDGVERGYIKSDYLAREDVLTYVLKRVLQMTHVTFSEPDACKALLEEFGRSNDPVREWWLENEAEFTWDLLPTAFLYDFFIAWFRKTHPSGVPVNRNEFATKLVDLLTGSAEWTFVDPQKKHRPCQKLSVAEPLIDAWDLKDWTNRAYSGTDVAKKCVPFPLKTNYIGVVRNIQPVVAGVQDDDEDAPTVGAAA